jgi:hypothetical protein
MFLSSACVLGIFTNMKWPTLLGIVVVGTGMPTVLAQPPIAEQIGKGKEWSFTTKNNIEYSDVILLGFGADCAHFYIDRNLQRLPLSELNEGFRNNVVTHYSYKQGDNTPFIGPEIIWCENSSEILARQWKPDALLTAQLLNKRLKINNSSFESAAVYSITYTLDKYEWGFKDKSFWNPDVFLKLQIQGVGEFVLPQGILDLQKGKKQTFDWIGPLLTSNSSLLITFLDDDSDENNFLHALSKTEVKLPPVSGELDAGASVDVIGLVGAELRVAPKVEVKGGVFYIKTPTEEYFTPNPDVGSQAELTPPPNCIELLQKDGSIMGVRKFRPWAIKAPIKNAKGKKMGEIELKCLHAYLGPWGESK